MMKVFGKIHQIEEPLGAALKTIRRSRTKTFKVNNTIERFR